MSAVPCPTTSTESCVVGVPIQNVWDKLKAFKWDAMAPKCVSKVEKTSGEECQVGACFKVSYAAGGSWEIRATAFSERDYTIAYEVTGTDPAHPASSIVGEMKLQRVSDTNETYLVWETIFSNDVDQQVISDQKYKKLDFFKDMKATMK